MHAANRTNRSAILPPPPAHRPFLHDRLEAHGWERDRDAELRFVKGKWVVDVKWATEEDRIRLGCTYHPTLRVALASVRMTYPDGSDLSREVTNTTLGSALLQLAAFQLPDGRRVGDYMLEQHH